MPDEKPDKPAERPAEKAERSAPRSRGKTWLDDFPSWVRTIAQLGAIGVIIMFYREDRQQSKEERREAASISRQDHAQAFQTMRQDQDRNTKLHIEEGDKTRETIRKGYAAQKDLAKTLLDGLEAVKTTQAEVKTNQKAVLDGQRDTQRLLQAVEALAKEVKGIKGGPPCPVPDPN